MQKQIPKEAEAGMGQFHSILAKAKAGDNEAMMVIRDFFQDDINRLSRYTSMPKDDFKQEMKTSFIELVRKGEIGI
ncbi:helix-turn-helix domain-containing protein [Neobacillus sp. SCS-31]|uniref:helix-turn-helix domain-containing protein n=1 Tax=Neobacillus oceani TaxID=3115292 RepID=UPI003906CB64